MHTCASGCDNIWKKPFSAITSHDHMVWTKRQAYKVYCLRLGSHKVIFIDPMLLMSSPCISSVAVVIETIGNSFNFLLVFRVINNILKVDKHLWNSIEVKTRFSLRHSTVNRWQITWRYLLIGNNLLHEWHANDLD